MVTDMDAALSVLVGMTLKELGEYEPETVAEALAVGLVREALDGKSRTTVLIVERIAGRSRQKADAGVSEMDGIVDALKKITGGGVGGDEAR